MRVIERSEDVATLELTTGEVAIISNAINEICHGPEAIEEWEFETRVGVSRQEATALLDKLHELR